MITAGDFRKGMTFEMNGEPHVVLDFQHVKPGKGAAFVRTKYKNILTGATREDAFNPNDKFEPARIDTKTMQYLYNDGELYYFMDMETYDQIPISGNLITGFDFMKESDIIEVVSDADTETVLFGEMPVKTNLRVTHSEPGIKGDTATNTLKPATLETGVEVRVPLFVNEGDLVQVDTRDGSYLQRVKE